jgi:hypothetical protein
MGIIDDFLAFGWIISLAIIAGVCLAMRIRFPRLFDPKPTGVLRGLMIVSSIVVGSWGVAVTFRVPLPYETSVRQVGMGLFLVYLWGQTIQTVLSTREQDRLDS